MNSVEAGIDAGNWKVFKSKGGTMTTEQLDALFQLAHEVFGVNSALDMVRSVDHLGYEDAKSAIRKWMAEARKS